MYSFYFIFFDKFMLNEYLADIYISIFYKYKEN